MIIKIAISILWTLMSLRVFYWPSIFPYLIFGLGWHLRSLASCPTFTMSCSLECAVRIENDVRPVISATERWLNKWINKFTTDSWVTRWLCWMKYSLYSGHVWSDPTAVTQVPLGQRGNLGRHRCSQIFKTDKRKCIFWGHARETQSAFS